MNETQGYATEAPQMPPNVLGFGQVGGQLAVPSTPHYDVVIKKVENGFLITVGCKHFVSDSWDKLSDGLRLYWDKPEEARKKYCK